MKQILTLLALGLLCIASCMKEQVKRRSIDAEMMSRITFTDDFYLSHNLKPRFHKIDSATLVTIFADSVYNRFGGSLKSICFQFSNPDINYRNLKLIVASTTGAQRATYTAATTTMQNGVKQLVFDSLEHGILISPGWSTIILKAKILGSRRETFVVTIPEGGITYHSINDQPGQVLGLPLSTAGLRIR